MPMTVEVEDSKGELSFQVLPGLNICGLLKQASLVSLPPTATSVHCTLILVTAPVAVPLPLVTVQLWPVGWVATVTL